jgi:hypothetical protein
MTKKRGYLIFNNLLTLSFTILNSVSNSQRRWQRSCQEADNVSSQLAVSRRIK